MQCHFDTDDATFILHLIVEKRGSKNQKKNLSELLFLLWKYLYTNVIKLLVEQKRKKFLKKYAFIYTQTERPEYRSTYWLSD